ncbi:MAG: hypothetical protein ABIQ16_27390 [Polyangiaceae bacterium]
MRVQRRFKPFRFVDWIWASRTTKPTAWTALCGIGLALSPSQAHAQASSLAAPPEFSVTSSGSSECPAPRAVERAVLRLIPREHYKLLTVHSVRVELEDREASYRVRVFKDGALVEKTYADPARDCAGRANFAAVFAVLTVMPPELGFAALPEPEPAPKPPPPPPIEVPKMEPPSPPQPPLAQIELSGLIAYAPGILDAPELTSFGGELRVALGRGVLSGTLSVAYLARAKFEIDGVQGDVTRLPASVGVRLRSDFESWELSGDLGALAVSERVRATNLIEPRAHHLLELGLRAGLQVSTGGNAQLRPFAAAFAWVSPGPRDLSALPQAVLGNLPYLWVGGAVGLSLGL